MSAASDAAIRDLIRIRLKAMAALQMQMATALFGKGQDELRKHFIDSSELLWEAHRALGDAK